MFVCASTSLLLSVPLLIAHPLSPYKGQHYKLPVELVDVYPTIQDLILPSRAQGEACSGFHCKPLQGKSLAPVILGHDIYTHWHGKYNFDRLATINQSHPREMPQMVHNFAISQYLRCADKDKVPVPPTALDSKTTIEKLQKINRKQPWRDCNLDSPRPNERMLMGYSMRTPEYRYTVYFNFDEKSHMPRLGQNPYAEELYDHKNETLADFTHREVFNLAVKPGYQPLIKSLRTRMIQFLRASVSFHDHSLSEMPQLPT